MRLLGFFLLFGSILVTVVNAFHPQGRWYNVVAGCVGMVCSCIGLVFNIKNIRLKKRLLELKRELDSIKDKEIKK